MQNAGDIMSAIKDMPTLGKERCYIGVDFYGKFSELPNTHITIVNKYGNVLWRWSGDGTAASISFGIALMLEGKVKGGRVAICRSAFGIALIHELATYIPRRKFISFIGKRGSFMQRIHIRALGGRNQRLGITSDKISAVMSNNYVKKNLIEDVDVMTQSHSVAITAAAIDNPSIYI